MPNWEEVEEPRYIKEAQEGSADSFGALYTHYAEGVFRFLFLHLDNRLDAEDLTGEVFYKAWKALPQYQQQGIPFAAFLFRIARNALIDFYRKSRQTKRDVSLDEAEERQNVEAASTGGLQGKEEGQELIRLMRGLREDYRMVIGLRFFSGLSPEETAKVMKRSVGAIRVLQFRALAALREKFVDES
jgi:RNA polymerase sigma-70 factor (ECF subfamily)